MPFSEMLGEPAPRPLSPPGDCSDEVLACGCGAVEGSVDSIQDASP